MINYVIAAYMGERIRSDDGYIADRTVFVREHLASLARLEHELGQVTLVISGEGSDSAERYLRNGASRLV